MPRTPSNSNEIEMFLHCALCIRELPRGESPQTYASLEAGYTVKGIQIWCKRHNCNILHVDFEGTKHPGNTTRAKGGITGTC